jgi:hypothetical protein
MIGVAIMTTVGSVLLMVLGAGGASSAGADTTTSAFYLDIGASASVGVQPTLAFPYGQPTSSGYANDLVAIEAAKGISLRLDQVGCPGETTTTMIYGGDHCYVSPDSQLSAAILFLHTHQDESGVVTIDLGFNNVVHCLRRASDAKACVDEGFAHLGVELPQILTDLQSVAGPDVTFIGVGHYDPYLAKSLDGLVGKLHATRSLQDIGHLNDILSDTFHSHGIAVADVASVFQSGDVTPTALAGIGVVPRNVANICTMTWMCQPPPVGPNLHPNDLGYQEIALAIADKFPASL